MQPNQSSDTASGIDKTILRRTMLARRDALSPDFVAAASLAVARQTMALPQVASACEVLAYLPIRNEVDATLVAGRLLDAGKRLLLPRCRKDAPGWLDLGPITCLSEAVPGRFGILEPPADCCRGPEAFAPDVILAPGVAFDLQGARLGFGGGYYDRLLALPMAANAFVVGLAYAFQLLPRLPADPWDRPVDAVVTELQTHLVAP